MLSRAFLSLLLLNFNDFLNVVSVAMHSCFHENALRLVICRFMPLIGTHIYAIKALLLRDMVVKH